MNYKIEQLNTLALAAKKFGATHARVAIEGRKAKRIVPLEGLAELACSVTGVELGAKPQKHFVPLKERLSAADLIKAAAPPPTVVRNAGERKATHIKLTTPDGKHAIAAIKDAESSFAGIEIGELTEGYFDGRGKKAEFVALRSIAGLPGAAKAAPAPSSSAKAAPAPSSSAKAARSEGVRLSWTKPDVAVARATRHRVLVDGQEYRSVAAAFQALGLPMKEHISFRQILKRDRKASDYGRQWLINEA